MVRKASKAVITIGVYTLLHDIAITQTSMCRRITSSSCFTILVWFTSEYFRLCCRPHLALERTTNSKGMVLKVFASNTLCAKVPAGSRSNQRADVVRRRWNATRSDHQDTYTINPNFCRNSHTSHESMFPAFLLPSSSRTKFLQPENQHVKFNVDVKVHNDPDRLFTLMHEIITTQPDWQSNLAPRIVLGLWHPCFIAFAKARLPYCRRSYIGRNLDMARKYFWDDCDAFSIAFGVLTTADGEKYVSNSVSCCS
jgi:hypothetical protein